MRLSVRAFGFELTPTCWRAVHLEARFTSTRLLRTLGGKLAGSDLQSACAALEEAVRSLEVTSGTRLGIVLARPIVHLKRIALPKARRSDILQVVRAQATSIFALGKQAIVADIRWVSGNGRRRAARAEGLVAAAPEALMDALAASARTAGLRLSSADLSAGAVGLFLRHGTKSAGLVQDGGLEWVQYGKKGMVEASRYFPLGSGGGSGDHQTSSVAKLPEALEEEIQAKQAVLLGPRDLLGELQPQRKDETSASEYPMLEMSGVQGLKHTQFVAACGAGLQALGARAAFDLRPDSVQELDIARRGRRRLVLVGLLVSSAAFYTLSGYLRLRSEVAQLESGVAQLRPQAEEVLRLRDVISHAAGRADQLTELEAAQPRWTSVLAELARVLPADAYLTALREDGWRVRLEGYAATMSTTVSALEGSEVFDSVRLGGPVTRERTVVGERERFTLEAVVAGAERM